MNAMIYIRGNRADYDELGDRRRQGWSYDEVLPYFKRSEDNDAARTRSTASAGR